MCYWSHLMLVNPDKLTKNFSSSKENWTWSLIFLWTYCLFSKFTSKLLNCSVLKSLIFWQFQKTEYFVYWTIEDDPVKRKVFLSLENYQFVKMLSFLKVNNVVIAVSAWLRTHNMSQVTHSNSQKNPPMNHEIWLQNSKYSGMSHIFRDQVSKPTCYSRQQAK